MEILEQILTKENLNKAYKKVKTNKGAPGVDGVSVDDVYQQIIDNKNQILNQELIFCLHSSNFKNFLNISFVRIFWLTIICQRNIIATVMKIKKRK